MKNPLKSKTVWVNLVALVVAILRATGTLPDPLASAIEPHLTELVVGWAVTNLGLRGVTTDPIGWKPPDR